MADDKLQVGWADKVKLTIAALLVVVGVGGFYYLVESAMIVRVASVLGGLIAATVVGWLTVPGRQFYAFAQESVAETKKVVWPTRKETFQTTGVVFLFVVVMAVFLWLIDAGLLWMVRMVTGWNDL